MTLKRGVFYIILVLMLFANSYGQDNFDVVEANKEVNNLTVKLSIEQLKSSNLKSAIDSLEKLNKKAHSCVDDYTKQLSEINNQIKQFQSSASQDKSLNFLSTKKTEVGKKLESCKLFSLRVQEVITSFKDTITELTETKLLKKSIPAWEIFLVHEKIEAKQKSFIDFFPMISFANLQFAWATLTAFLFFIFLGLLVKWKIKKLSKSKKDDNFSHIVVQRYIVFLVLFGGLALFFYIYNPTVLITPVLFFAHLFVFLTLCLLLQLSSKFTKSIFIRFILFAFMAILTTWLRPVLIYFNVSYLAVRVFDILSVTLVALLFAYFGWAISSIFSKTFVFRFIQGALKFLLVLIGVVTIALEWVGYHDLATFILREIYRSIALLILFYVSLSIIKKSTSNFLYRFPKVCKFFSLKANRVFIELVLIKYVIYLLLLYGFIILMTIIWGTDPLTVDKTYAWFTQGILTKNFSISPLKTIYAMITFALISLFGRFLATQIGKQYLQDGDQAKQIAVSTIFIYISCAVALIISLIVLGVNFTGLAIIAGALSVGIGLGLQNIVNNFVSGIILLIERPIKPGDRILVGNVEGYVKKVRVRSTQIMTLSHEDVIVPNSDLITNNVTNFMFRDALWRVNCRVGVSYGSNIDKVKKVLLSVANAHKEVLKEGDHEPRVLFREFGDSSLLFELWCVIEDVNKKYDVESELNTEISKRFKQENITIAFPQRDIHIKS